MDKFTLDTSITFPALKDLNQQKLHKFLENVPLSGAEVISGRPAVPAPVDDAKIAANEPYTTDANFKVYTGYEHRGLLVKWKSDRTTTCNEFVGRCTTAMGHRGVNIGQFEIADILLRSGKGHCWVPTSSGSTPEYGDIFRLFSPEPDHNGMRLNHLAVSLHVLGNNWYTVESGQGGPSKGYDSLRRKKRDWPFPNLRGWVSMRTLLATGKPLEPWLGGWWKIAESTGTVYYYHFGADGRVGFTRRAPAYVAAAPVNMSMTGAFTMKGMFELTVSWMSPDVNETIKSTGGNATKRTYMLEGITDMGSKFKGERLLGVGIYR